MLEFPDSDRRTTSCWNFTDSAGILLESDKNPLSLKSDRNHIKTPILMEGDFPAGFHWEFTEIIPGPN